MSVINKRTLTITNMMTILLLGLVSSSPYVFAAKPDPGFMNSDKCKIFSPSSPIRNTTCCWKESDGLVFCQTCTYTPGEGYTSCDDKELQLDTPPNPPTSSSGPTAPYKMMEL